MLLTPPRADLLRANERAFTTHLEGRDVVVRVHSEARNRVFDQEAARALLIKDRMSYFQGLMLFAHRRAYGKMQRHFQGTCA